MIVLNVFEDKATLSGHDDHSKITNRFLNDPKSQKEFFGHFWEFGLLVRLDNAYCDSTKCFPAFAIIQKS